LVARSSGASERYDFTGGADPRSWLAFTLVTDHGFDEAAAVEVARKLFAPFLPPVVVTESAAKPYGMERG
jgi:hypothetical protein